MFPLRALAFVAAFPATWTRDGSDCIETRGHSRHLATKTPYRYVLNDDDSEIRFDGCTADKLWMVVRHGTRYPGKKVIGNMRRRLPDLRALILDNHASGRGEMCASALDNLTSWSPQINLADNKRLVHEGEDEMIELAERFQMRFPQVLPEEYSNKTYKFRSTATQRTIESRRHFTIGLFGRKVARHVWSPEPVHKDPVLRFYKLCTKWKKEVDKNPISLAEKIKFEESDTMKEVISSVSRRLGFAKDLPLDNVGMMYTTCAFESAWHPFAKSPWCSVFAERELEVLEYAEDLEYYWIDGYGYNINYEQACPIVGDMLRHLTSEDDPRSTIYFTHSGTLLKVLAHLGLYRDAEKLSHDGFDRKRLWRVSLIDAFATNLAFVRFRCGDDGDARVLALHQERVVDLPGCEPGVLCPLKDVLATYGASLRDCRFAEMCAA